LSVGKPGQNPVSIGAVKRINVNEE